MTEEIAAVVNRHSPRLRDRHIAAVSAADHLCLSTSEAHAEAFIVDVMARGVGGLVVGGGDGTLAHALTTLSNVTNGEVARFPTLGLLRLGTGNAAAEAFAVPRATRSSIEALLEQLRDGASGVPLRTVSAAGRLGCFAGFGVDAQLLEDHARSNAWLVRRGLSPLARGALSYVISAAGRSLPRFVLGRRPTVTAVNRGRPARVVARDQVSDATVTAEQALWSGRCTLASCATIPTFGFGLRMFTLAEHDPDRFQLRISDAGVLEIVSNTRAAFRGEYFSDNVHDFLCDRVELTLSEPSPFEVNGDLVGVLDRVEVSLGPTFDLLT